jgi:hypothetical protein
MRDLSFLLVVVEEVDELLDLQQLRRHILDHLRVYLVVVGVVLECAGMYASSEPPPTPPPRLWTAARTSPSFPLRRRRGWDPTHRRRSAARLGTSSVHATYNMGLR